MKQHNARNIGFLGEQQAEEYLIQNNYIVLKKNFCCKGGEIDIIAKSPEAELLFIEVKCYTPNNWLHPLESITKSKQKHIIKAAKYYLLTNNSYNLAIRFDAIIIFQNTIQHLKNIFQV